MYFVLYGGVGGILQSIRSVAGPLVCADDPLLQSNYSWLTVLVRAEIPMFKPALSQAFQILQLLTSCSNCNHLALIELKHILGFFFLQMVSITWFKKYSKYCGSLYVNPKGREWSIPRLWDNTHTGGKFILTDQVLAKYFVVTCPKH